MAGKIERPTVLATSAASPKSVSVRPPRSHADSAVFGGGWGSLAGIGRRVRYSAGFLSLRGLGIRERLSGRPAAVVRRFRGLGLPMSLLLLVFGRSLRLVRRR